MDSKDKTSRSSSKENLNESSRPLLDEEGGTVAIEMNRTDDTTAAAGEEAVKESTLEKSEEAKADGKGSESKKEKKEKKKKEKKEKEEKEKTPKRRSSFAEKLTAGLNLLDRDDRNVNDHINITFEDVLAEPDSSHSFVCVWQNSFIAFDVVKFWFYRILSAILFIPFALIWGIFFAILTSVNVWIISPLLRIFDVVLFIVHRIWSGLIKTFLDPLFKSIGQICSNVQVTKQHKQWEA